MTEFTDQQKAALAAPLERSAVKKNPKGFDYVEAWHAIAEANRIFGFDAWNRQTVEMRLLGEPRLVGDNWRVGYFAKVRITVGEIVREGCGFGSGINKDVDQAHEGALKEAESDAMKRALMTFGNPFGLALYDKEKANVANAPRELNTAVVAATAAIRMCETTAQLKAWWDEHKPALDQLPDDDYALVGHAFKAKSAELKPKAVAHG
jgi:DNA repair and recombination protein RAD52